MRPSSAPPLLSVCDCVNGSRIFHQTLILILTFFAYASLHASRKPPSIVKSVLGPNISNPKSDVAFGWPPFNSTDKGTHRLGELDLAFLSSYAFGMFFSGHFADSTDLRIFLSSGMLLSAVFTLAFGFAYFFRIHNFLYFLSVQILCGLSQSTAWPCVVSVLANWFGKSKRGLIMGVWNSHTSIGNIIGSFLASYMLNFGWGWSFFSPAFFVFFIAILVYLFLVVSPHLVALYVDTEIELNSVDVSDNVESEDSTLLHSHHSNSSPLKPDHTDAIPTADAIGFLDALKLPGVAPFATCLFFSKLVAYTFLYWLPFYIRHTAIAGVHLSHQTAGMLSTIFDVGGILGGIVAGFVSDKLDARAITSVTFLILSIPALVVYRVYGSSSMFTNNALMFLSGTLVNGPYALITTAVAADLGTQSAIRGNSRALATVTAIIDGTGSIGAAIGPLLVGYITSGGWNRVFAMLIVSIFAAALSLIPAIKSEINEKRSKIQLNGTAH